MYTWYIRISEARAFLTILRIHPLYQVSHGALDLPVCRLFRASPDNKRKLASACGGRPQEPERLPDSPAKLVSLCRLSQSSRYAYTHLHSVIRQEVQHEIPVRDGTSFLVYFTIRWSRYPSLRHRTASLRSRRQALPALRPASGNDLSPIGRFHPAKKPVSASSLAPLGLVRTLHGRHPPRDPAAYPMVREIISWQKIECQ